MIFAQVFHVVGLTLVAGAVTLQTLMFGSIAAKGFFFAGEPNSIVLGAEIVLTALAAVYCGYLVYSRIVRGLRNE